MSVPSLRRCRGITLLDFLIALTVAGILFGVAIPGFRDAIVRTQATAARGALTTTLFDAQRDATVLGREIVICPATADQCAGGHDWSEGWLAFVDGDGDRRHGPGEAIVHREPPLPDTVRILGSVGRPRIVYQPNGGSAGANATFVLCDRRGPGAALTLILSNGAGLRTDRPSAAAAAACVATLPSGA